MCVFLLYAFVDAAPFEELQNDFGEDGAQARPPEKDVGAGLDGAAVSSQQQRGSAHEVNELLLAGDFVLQHKGAHHRGERFLLKRLSFICKSTWRPAGTLARAADCIEGWAHRF
jgi:hypothetical protein